MPGFVNLMGDVVLGVAYWPSLVEEGLCVRGLNPLASSLWMASLLKTLPLPPVPRP